VDGGDLEKMKNELLVVKNGESETKYKIAK